MASRQRLAGKSTLDSGESERGTTVGASEQIRRICCVEGTYGSVLYFASHGSEGSVTLSDRESIDLRCLGQEACLWGQCVGCYVHFSACNVFENEDAVRDFLVQTGAAAVSGYRTDVGWAESKKPAVPLDLMLFNHLWEVGLERFDADGAIEKLEAVEHDLQRRFGDCQFNIMLAARE